MKRFFLPVVTSVTILLFAASCYYDNEEALYPSLGSACDTTAVTFSGKIVPLLSNNCLSCHSNAASASAGGGIKLQDYADVQSRTVAIAGSIKHTGSYSPMPKNGGTLNSCLISQFDIWVKNGAPNK